MLRLLPKLLALLTSPPRALIQQLLVLVLLRLLVLRLLPNLLALLTSRPRPALTRLLLVLVLPLL